MRRPARFGIALCLCYLLSAAALRAAESSSPPEISANDNREAAGKLQDGVLRLRLELRAGRWHPEDANGWYRDVYAFAEAGKAAQIPGPLLRVPQGTELRITLTNTLSVAAKIFGLHGHPSEADAGIALAAGETREIQFRAGEPGTFLYWATTSNSDLEHREDAETGLSGAFVVDAAGKPAPDRVFVIGYWFWKGEKPQTNGFPWINGKSWPYTERESYTVGETVHWRVINGSVEEHAMHLHGFYFDVDGEGDGTHYVKYAKEERPKLVTERVLAGHSYEMTWVPERAGNWLFHCHMVAHMEIQPSLHPKAEMEMGHGDSEVANLGMGGLVIGVKVAPAEGKSEAPAKWTAAHKLELVLTENPEKIPYYRVAVKDPRLPGPAEKDAPPSLLGPPIVLVRGEQTEILVNNQTKGPSAIHWHGIEIENYYDGVAGWGSDGKKSSPEVEAGGTFVARMTPPRAGTFIYHTHWHDKKQIENGVYGPLIVLEPGQKYDPELDRAILFSEGRFPALGVLMLVNGGAQPDPVTLKSGTRYRFRLINITANEADLHVRMLMGGTPVQWKVVARDGNELPEKQRISGAAEIDLTVGGTADVELQVERKGNADMVISSELFRGLIMQPFIFE
jgi:manganese oxidase